MEDCFIVTIPRDLHERICKLLANRGEAVTEASINRFICQTLEEEVSCQEWEASAEGQAAVLEALNQPLSRTL